jgi:hypothetical protein
MTGVTLLLLWETWDLHQSIAECVTCGWTTNWFQESFTATGPNDRMEAIARITTHTREAHEQPARLVKGIRP